MRIGRRVTLGVGYAPGGGMKLELRGLEAFQRVLVLQDAPDALDRLADAHLKHLAGIYEPMIRPLQKP